MSVRVVFDEMQWNQKLYREQNLRIKTRFSIKIFFRFSTENSLELTKVIQFLFRFSPKKSLPDGSGQAELIEI
jgi:hypothetical protein